MSNLNKIVLSFVIFSVIAANSVEHYVKPISSTTCPSQQPCLTLSEYLQDPTTYFTSGSTFTLLQGQHLLNQTMALSNVKGIILGGAGKNKTVIRVVASGNITLTSCENVMIYSLEILSSGRKKTAGAVITSKQSKLKIFNVIFNGGRGRQAMYAHGFKLEKSVALFFNCSFIDWRSINGAPIYMRKSRATFSNFTASGNTQGYGATFRAYSSRLNFTGEVNIKNNVAYNGVGGTLFLLQSQLTCAGKVIFFNNSVMGESGGAICCINSQLEFHGSTNFTMNSAKKGGGIYAMDSDINFTGNSTFLKNKAIEGGGIALERQATDGLKSSRLILFSSTTITFDSNKADKNGGGLYIVNPFAIQCGKQIQESCFFKLESNSSSSLKVRFNFVHNYAGEAGTVVYGGYFKYCEVENSMTENISDFFNVISNNKNTSFSSDPNRVVLCDSDNHTYEYDNRTIHYTDLCHTRKTCRTIYATRGENFTLSVKAVGHEDISVASTINAYIEGDDKWTELTPKSHRIGETCTNITFKLFAKSANNTLILHPAGSCSRNKKIVYVMLTACPPGFVLEGHRCKCDKELIDQSVVKCNADTLQLDRLGNSWIYPIWNKNATFAGFVYHPVCPIQHCKPEGKVTHLTFSPHDNDILCLSDHSGLLCGACREGYSLTFNTFMCKKCSSNYLGLLLFFGFSGVALIAMLLALHMTVAAGTINGLILYANIVNVNSIIFYPPNHTNILTVFISWLNLDFGIDSCFYDGLDFYSYAWLQYAFPIYLWFLIGMTIWSHKLSAKVSKLFGSNPVAVLATVTLMSYTKLLQAITLTLSYTFLEYSDGKRKRVWYFDGNITYFKGKHGILSLVAVCVVILFLIPYFFLMLFGYRLQAYSAKRAFWWCNKLKPLLDAYYAPYKSEMRFWPGFMLLVRGSLYMVTALSNSNEAILFAISFVFTAVALMPWLGYRVYEKLYNDILEASFILNICFLSIASLYINSIHGYQKAVISLSISIALLQFLGITCFHLFLRLRNTKLVTLLLSRSSVCVVKAKSLAVKSHSSTSCESKGKKEVQTISESVVDIREPLIDNAKFT